MKFKFKKLDIPDVMVISPTTFKDERGILFESYSKKEFEKNLGFDFVQDNHVISHKNVLRGLHYQLKPYEQGKLIRVIKGAILDVAVDIRKGSPFYGKWVSIELNSHDKNMIWVPPGFAHGYFVKEDYTEILYKVTKPYHPDSERGILWNDHNINIKWPSPNPKLSIKDKNLSSLGDAENNFIYSKK